MLVVFCSIFMCTKSDAESVKLKAKFHNFCLKYLL